MYKNYSEDVVLGSRDQYYIQTNNASAYLIRAYMGRIRFIACGPESAAMGFDIAGRDMSIFTPGEQPGDAIINIFHDPKHLPAYIDVRGDRKFYEKYSPNEIPQIYPAMGKIIFGKDVASFEWGNTYSQVRESIQKKSPVMLCGNFPCGGHYVLCVGYNDKREELIYNDPYPKQWADKNGFRRRMDQGFIKKKLKGFRVIFHENKKGVIV